MQILRALDRLEFKLETVLESNVYSCYWRYGHRGTSSYNRFSTLLIADAVAVDVKE